MNKFHLNHHIQGWLEKVESNIAEFQARTDVTDEERAEFITFQYHLVMLIRKTLAGKTYFVGASPIKPVEDPQEDNIIGV